VGDNVFQLFLAATGDVNASFIPQTVLKNTTKLLIYNEIIANTGDIVDIPFFVSEPSILGAFNLDISYNKQLFEVVDIVGHSVFNLNKENATIKIAWIANDQNQVLSNGIIASIRIKILQPIKASDACFELENETQFGDLYAKPIHNLSVFTPSLITKDSNCIITNFEHFAAPIPAKNSCKLYFTLPTEGTFAVTIYNHLGQIVHNYEIQQVFAGANNHEIQQSDVKSYGLFFYRIVHKDKSSIRTGSGSILFIK
jgi:hypothetical protein